MQAFTIYSKQALCNTLLFLLLSQPFKLYLQIKQSPIKKCTFQY
nr:MAG TPA: hypothetical protein [Bacteriophage sp.]